MDKRSWFVSSLLGLVCFVNSAYAALELELTQGVDRAIPIAIENFNSNAPSTSDKITEVVNQDLSHSGRFKVLVDPSIRSSGAPTNISFWRGRGADSVVVGSLTVTPDGGYDVNFKLINAVGDSRVLLSKHLITSNTDARRLGHRISDELYFALTGNRGVFSTKIAYVVIQRANAKAIRYLLNISDADGQHPRTLLQSTAPIMSPAWSPDAQKIAYVSFENRRASIHIVDLRSGQISLVSSFPGINGAPAWSPDGKKLAVVLSKAGSPNLYLIDIATHSLVRLTNGLQIDTEPSFAPDGESLIFTSDRGGAPQIYQLSLDDKSVKRLTFVGDYNACPEFSANGHEFVLLHRRNGMYNIAIQDLNNSQIRVLTSYGQHESPSLAPNGEMIIYATKLGGTRVLNVVSVDGKVKIRLPSHDGEAQEPAWSPFIV